MYKDAEVQLNIPQLIADDPVAIVMEAASTWQTLASRSTINTGFALNYSTDRCIMHTIRPTYSPSASACEIVIAEVTGYAAVAACYGSATRTCMESSRLVRMHAC